MSKAFIAAVLQDSLACPGVAAGKTADDLVGAIVAELKQEGGFTLPSFGTFTALRALNSRTGKPLKIQAGRTMRFKASPILKKMM